ncbi:MAG: carboxypeptidase-like regulatory domain-containing protein [Gemmatimonadota bacterium]|nr:carboxypeptidase regulatory-like domain-containing protein [Gemmatimonadota bacterium]
MRTSHPGRPSAPLTVSRSLLAATVRWFVVALALGVGVAACRDGQTGALTAFGDGATIEGDVLDTDGGGVAGVRVTLVGGDGVARSTVTDSRGQYRFSAIDPGFWTLTVEPPLGYVPIAGETLQRQIDLVADAVVRQSFVLASL